MFTRDQAEKLFKTQWWMDVAPETLAKIQLSQDYLLMPYWTYHQALERALGRGLYFNEVQIRRWEFLHQLCGKKYALTTEECLQMIPLEHRAVL